MTFRQFPLSLGLAGLLAAPAFGAALATKPEAEAMVKKAVGFLKANGKDKTIFEINHKTGRFSDRDLYLTVYDTDGVALAHGANVKLVGHDLLAIKDVDGKAFMRERIELAKTKPAFWQEYKFTNPVSGKIEPKAMYCQPYEELIVCGGVYLK